MDGNKCLFNQVDWHSFQRKRKEGILREIQGMEGDRLLNTSVEDLCDYFEKKYRLMWRYCIKSISRLTVMKNRLM